MYVRLVVLKGVALFIACFVIRSLSRWAKTDLEHSYTYMKHKSSIRDNVVCHCEESIFINSSSVIIYSVMKSSICFVIITV